MSYSIQDRIKITIKNDRDTTIEAAGFTTVLSDSAELLEDRKQ